MSANTSRYVVAAEPDELLARIQAHIFDGEIPLVLTAIDSPVDPQTREIIFHIRNYTNDGFGHHFFVGHLFESDGSRSTVNLTINASPILPQGEIEVIIQPDS